MYLEFVKQSVASNKAVNLLYLGIKYTILPDAQGISVINCYLDTKSFYQCFEDIMQNNTINSALNSTDRNNIRVWLEEHRYNARKQEFIEQVQLGGEIEFVYKGLGYFLTHIYEAGKSVRLIYNLYNNKKYQFKDTKELLDICLDACPLDYCWDNIEIISYL